MIENYNTIFASLPNKVSGFIMYDSADDFYTIVLNKKMSYLRNKETFLHELRHIKNGDYMKIKNVGILEYQMRNK